MPDPTDEIARLFTNASVPEPAPTTLLDDLRRAVEAIAERDRLHPGPAAGTDLTLDEFRDLMGRGPWPRRVAISSATFDRWVEEHPVPSQAWRADPSAAFGVPVDRDDVVPDGMIRVVQASRAAEQAAVRERVDAFARRSPGPSGPMDFLRGVTGA